MSKIYTIKSVQSGREYLFTGTMKELCTGVFSYTLECGHSWNSRIPRFPRTGLALVNALNKSKYECRRYNDYYELVTD